MKPSPVVSRNCRTCGVTFSFKALANRNGDRKFCSSACMRQRPGSGLEARFWARVDKTGDCWIWTGAPNDFGYGTLRAGRRGSKLLRTHVLSWEIHNGAIPDGLCVLHTCDNPPCVRPDHLFLGTRDDNNQDMLTKGRYSRDPSLKVRGSKHGNAKLTEDLVRDARRRHAGGDSFVDLASEYGVSPRTVEYAVERNTWRHVL